MSEPREVKANDGMNALQKRDLAWKNFGVVCGEEVIDDLMYHATGNLISAGDPITTGQKIGRRDLALELLSRMGVV